MTGSSGKRGQMFASGNRAVVGAFQSQEGEPRPPWGNAKMWPRVKLMGRGEGRPFTVGGKGVTPLRGGPSDRE